MKKIIGTQTTWQGALQQKEVKKLIVMPLARRMQKHADAGKKAARRSFKKIQELEKMIEIIAREIGRQSIRPR